MVYLAVMVGRCENKVVREWCPSTTGPVLTLCLHLAWWCYTSGATISAHAKNKKGLNPGEHVQLSA